MGVKNPRYLISLLQAKWRRRWRGHVWLASSKNARYFSFVQHIMCLFYIIFISHYAYKRAQVVGMVKFVGYASLGPGFDSQVPQKLYVIFHNVFLCRLSRASHHGLLHPKCHVSLNGNPKAKRRGTPCYLVNAHADNSRSQRRLKLSGPEICKLTS